MKNNLFTAKKICVVGLGYVGLPLAVEFGKKFETLGFDIAQERIDELRKGFDRTNELSKDDILNSKNLTFTADILDLKDSNVYIISVPTPVDEFKKPNLAALISASRAVGQVLGKNDIVIYESTVYPGVTEDECVPILEQISGLTFNLDFTVGYSPERINPGDKNRTLKSIIKVVSGSTARATQEIDSLYSSIIDAGTYVAPSIKVAEAAKVIENTQRDLNIALINELAMLFNQMGIDTEQVLLAAETKWNFISMRPGLVGGHCIGVDPYYLTHKAQSLGFHPELILSARRINDSMPEFIASRILKAIVQKKLLNSELRFLVMGCTFKENCPDVRNTKVVDLISELESFGLHVDAYDPVMSEAEFVSVYNNINVVSELKPEFYDGVVLSVAHDEIKQLGLSKIRSLCRGDHVIFDLKYLFPACLDVIRL